MKVDCSLLRTKHYTSYIPVTTCGFEGFREPLDLLMSASKSQSNVQLYKIESIVSSKPSIQSTTPTLESYEPSMAFCRTTMSRNRKSMVYCFVQLLGTVLSCVPYMYDRYDSEWSAPGSHASGGIHAPFRYLAKAVRVFAEDFRTHCS